MQSGERGLGAGLDQHRLARVVERYNASSLQVRPALLGIPYTAIGEPHLVTELDDHFFLSLVSSESGIGTSYAPRRVFVGM